MKASLCSGSFEASRLSALDLILCRGVRLADIKPFTNLQKQIEFLSVYLDDGEIVSPRGSA